MAPGRALLELIGVHRLQGVMILDLCDKAQPVSRQLDPWQESLFER